MKITTWITAVVTDPQGKVVSRKRWKARSYVLAFIDQLNVQMSQTTRSITDIAGVSQSVVVALKAFNVVAAITADTMGILVGTGTTAVALADYKLATQITEGSTSGKLLHQALTVNAPSTVGSSRQFTITRNFLNQSGASITVNEVGLVEYQSLTALSFLIERSIIAGGAAVANNYTLAITYTISVTV